MTAYSASTTFSVFEPNATAAGDPTSVPASAAACLASGATTLCDATVGSIAMGTGVCSAPPLGDTALCACVNNALPCPQFTAPACANNAGAYQTTEQVDAAGACANIPLCINIVSAGGTDPVVDDVTQNCSGADTIANWVEAHRAVTCVMVFLAVIIISLIAAAIARWQLSSDMPVATPSLTMTPIGSVA